MAPFRDVRVYLGSDHAGFDMKAYLVEPLSGLGHDVVDVGPAGFDPDDDYPPFCIETARRVVANSGSLGVVIGGSLAGVAVVGAGAAGGGRSGAGAAGGATAGGGTSTVPGTGVASGGGANTAPPGTGA